MKLKRELNFSSNAVGIIICLTFFIASCRKPESSPCDGLYCKPCQLKVPGTNASGETCACYPDSSILCPADVVNGYYDYNECNCRCNYGWVGNKCDQRDTTLFIRLKHGSDTASLVQSVTYELEPVLKNLSSYDILGIFSDANGIDTIKMMSLPLGKGNYALYDIDLTHIEIKFSNGDRGYSYSGTINVDSFALYATSYISGTFYSDIENLRTGEFYYLREGTFKLH